MSVSVLTWAGRKTLVHRIAGIFPATISRKQPGDIHDWMPPIALSWPCAVLVCRDKPAVQAPDVAEGDFDSWVVILYPLEEVRVSVPVRKGVVRNIENRIHPRRWLGDTDDGHIVVQILDIRLPSILCDL